MPELQQQLPDGPIDFIGDVHGELKRCNSCCPIWDTKQMAPIPKVDDWSSWATWWIVVRFTGGGVVQRQLVINGNATTRQP